MSRDYDDDYEGPDGGEPFPKEDDVPPASTGKTSVPGALMLATGVVNLLVGLGGFMMGVTFQKVPRAEFEKAYAQQDPQQRKQLEDQGWTTDDLLNVYIRGGYGVGIAGVAGGLLAVVGGVCMLARKARGLAIISALVTAFPGTSPCCLLGLPIGIWALVVLFQSDVKAAFR